jgi:serine/threonine protein kinase
VIHRDIKPDNLLFVNRKSDSPLKVGRNYSIEFTNEDYVLSLKCLFIIFSFALVSFEKSVKQIPRKKKVIDFGLSDFMDKITAAAKTIKLAKPKKSGEEGGDVEFTTRKVMPKAGENRIQ